MEKQVRNEKSKKTGVVVSISGEKTIKVVVSRRIRHGLIGKVISKTKNYLVHNETIEGIKSGDHVEIVECSPKSKLKRWRVNKVIS